MANPIPFPYKYDVSYSGCFCSHMKSSSTEFLSGHLTLRIFLTPLFWKVLLFFLFLSVVSRVLQPYNKTDRTRLLIQWNDIIFQFFFIHWSWMNVRMYNCSSQVVDSNFLQACIYTFWTYSHSSAITTRPPIWQDKKNLDFDVERNI